MRTRPAALSGEGRGAAIMAAVSSWSLPEIVD